MSEGIVTILVFAVMLLGLVGAIVPGLPGLPVIFLAALVHKILFPDLTSWWLVLWLGAIAVAGFAVDFLAGWAGTKMFGASKWGFWGSVAGFFLGIPFALPGMILGPVLGAVVGEMLGARRDWKAASKSGVGAGVGLALSTLVHLAMGLLMIGSFALALLLD